MTLVTIDLGDVAGGHDPDDHVIIRAEAFRESQGGGVTSTAEVKIPLVNGVGQAEVEPGPVVVSFRCQAVADTREKRGVVPDSGTVGIEDVIAGAFEYTPPVANRALEDIQEALDGALGEVGSAVESQIEGIPHRGKMLAVGSDLNELRTPGPYYSNISGVSTSILNRPTWANVNPFTVEVSRASLTNNIQYQVFTQGTSGAVRKSIRYLHGATVHPWQDIPIGIDFAGLLEEMVEVDLSRVVTIGDSQVGGAGKWPDKLNALSNEVTVVNQGAAGATPDEVLLRTSTRGVMVQPGVTLQPGVVVPVTLDWVPLTAPHRDFGIAGQINGQPSSLYYRREISGWTVSLAQGQPSLNVTEPMEWRVVPSENKARRIAWFGGNSIRTGLSRPGETLAEHVMSAYSHVIKKWGPSTLVMGYVPAYGDMVGRDVADEIEKFLSRVAPENFLNIRRRLQDAASQVLGRSLTPGDLEDISDGFLPQAMYESDNVHLQDITHAGVASIVSDFPAGSTHELAIGQTALSGYVTQSDLDLRVPVGAIESLGQRIDGKADKAYVDTELNHSISSVGDAAQADKIVKLNASGKLHVFNGGITEPNDVVNKQYVDTQVNFSIASVGDAAHAGKRLKLNDQGKVTVWDSTITSPTDVVNKRYVDNRLDHSISSVGASDQAGKLLKLNASGKLHVFNGGITEPNDVVNKQYVDTRVKPLTSPEPTRAPLSNPGTWSVTEVPSAEYPKTMSRDRTTWFTGGWSTVWQSTNQGETWEVLHKFSTSCYEIVEASDGELFAFVGVPRTVYKSVGYPALGVNATWEPVLTMTNPGASISYTRSFSQHENIVVIGEYSPKYGNNAALGENGRWVWLSLDYGNTFKTIFDLNAYVEPLKGDTVGIHVHGVLWDPYWDRIWVTFGDDVDGIVYSDDLGATWETAKYGDYPTAPGQVVGAVAMPNCILFGTDNDDNGVMKIDRSPGKSGPYTLELAWSYPGGAENRSHLCHHSSRVQRPGDDGPAIFGFSAEDRPAKSFLVGTYDGVNFTVLWQDDRISDAGKGLKSVVGPTLSGEFILGLNDGPGNQWLELRGQAGIY